MFYDPDSDAVNRFRDWERAWSVGGWTPRILTRRMAMKHSQFKHEVKWNAVTPHRFSMLALGVALSVLPKEGCVLCDSMDCRPNKALGVHEVKMLC